MVTVSDKRRGILAVAVVLLLLVIGALATHGAGVALHARPAGAEVPATLIDPDVAPWLARALLALAAAWALIGMLSSRTRLVRRPGAAAARATWVGATRPWRARESTLGFLPLDRWLVMIVPAALLVGTETLRSSASWAPVAVEFGVWVVFALVVRLVVGRRSPWPVIATVGGVVVLRCAVTLIVLSLPGGRGQGIDSWTGPARFAYLTLLAALLLWVFVAGGWAMSTQLGPRRATGGILAGVGAALLVPVVVIVAAVGIERALTLWNDQAWLIPGRTPVADLPAESAWYAAALGLALVVIGGLLALPHRRPPSSVAL